MNAITKCSSAIKSACSELVRILPHCPVVATVVRGVVSPGHITVTWVALLSAMTLDIVSTIGFIEGQDIGLVINCNISSCIMITESVHLCFRIRLEVSLGKH